MNKPDHRFSDLFAQLGLPNDAQTIAQFLTTHTALTQGVRLHEAPFWTHSQSTFLRESWNQDSDWAGPVDQLSEVLQNTKS